MPLGRGAKPETAAPLAGSTSRRQPRSDEPARQSRRARQEVDRNRAGGERLHGAVRVRVPRQHLARRLAQGGDVVSRHASGGGAGGAHGREAPADADDAVFDDDRVHAAVRLVGRKRIVSTTTACAAGATNTPSSKNCGDDLSRSCAHGAASSSRASLTPSFTGSGSKVPLPRAGGRQ